MLSKFSISTKIFSCTIIILIGLASFFYIKYTTTIKDLNNSKNSVLTLNQNMIAYQDKLKEKADSMSNLALFVKGLQNQ